MKTYGLFKDTFDAITSFATYVADRIYGVRDNPNEPAIDQSRYFSFIREIMEDVGGLGAGKQMADLVVTTVARYGPKIDHSLYQQFFNFREGNLRMLLEKENGEYAGKFLCRLITQILKTDEYDRKLLFTTNFLIFAPHLTTQQIMRIYDVIFVIEQRPHYYRLAYGRILDLINSIRSSDDDIRF